MTDNPQATPTPPESSPDGALNTENMIPQSRFNQVNEERKALADRLASLEQAQDDQKQAELLKQNEFKTLYEQSQAELDSLKSIKEQATRFQDALAATNQTRIEQIPEDKRSIVPDYDDPVKLGAWLDANLSLLAATPKPTPPPMDGGAGTGGGTPNVKITQEELQMATAMGMSAEQYIKQKEKRNQPLDTSRFNG